MFSDKMNVELPSHILTLRVDVYFACKYDFHHAPFQVVGFPLFLVKL